MSSSARQGLVKLCGINDRRAVAAANDAQPDYVGMVIEYLASPRCLRLEDAVTLSFGLRLPVVAVLVEPDLPRLSRIAESLRPVAFQLSGDENEVLVEMAREALPEVEVWKVIHLPPAARDDDIRRAIEIGERMALAGASKLMIDARGSMPGGTGAAVDWHGVRRVVEASSAPVLLAGGLDADNVREAIGAARPAGVDVSSGTESAPGVKDPIRTESFVRAARAAFRDLIVTP